MSKRAELTRIQDTFTVEDGKIVTGSVRKAMAFGRMGLKKDDKDEPNKGVINTDVIFDFSGLSVDELALAATRKFVIAFQKTYGENAETYVQFAAVLSTVQGPVTIHVEDVGKNPWSDGTRGAQSAEKKKTNALSFLSELLSECKTPAEKMAKMKELGITI